MEKSANMLRKFDVKPSFQRIKIFDYLLNNRIHPTADTIYRDLVKEIPTLSLTTVYNTLKLFEKNNLLISIKISENEQRFDVDTSNHAHFYCKTCKEVYDIPTESAICTKTVEQYGGKIDEIHIYIKGKCNKCQEGE
ncbi:MAG: Fur family transcriptional regulator [Candidatus Muiribacteriota bacterium]